jgi:hypothetical protein
LISCFSFLELKPAEQGRAMWIGDLQADEESAVGNRHPKSGILMRSKIAAHARIRAYCLDYANAKVNLFSRQLPGRRRVGMVTLEAALGPVISSARPVRSLAISSTSHGCTATAPQLELFTCQVKSSRFWIDTTSSSKMHYFL